MELQVFMPFALLIWSNSRTLYEVKHSYTHAQMRKRSTWMAKSAHTMLGDCRGVVDPEQAPPEDDNKVVISMPLGLIGYVFEKRGECLGNNELLRGEIAYD